MAKTISLTQRKITRTVEIAKVDEDQRLVFGWFSIVEENGQAVIDKQGDVISADELEKAAYDFVLNCRIGSEMHEKKGVGRLVESVVLTKEKQQVLGIELNKVGWWGGFKVDDDEVWEAVKSGKYAAFSWGGNARVEEYA